MAFSAGMGVSRWRPAARVGPPGPRPRSRFPRSGAACWGKSPLWHDDRPVLCGTPACRPGLQDAAQSVDMAAIAGMTGTSPTPGRPKGWVGLGPSTTTRAIIRRSRRVGMGSPRRSHVPCGGPRCGGEHRRNPGDGLGMPGVDRLRVLSANDQKMYTCGSSAGPDTVCVCFAVHRHVEEHLFLRSNSTRTLEKSESLSSTIAVEHDTHVLP